MGLLSGRRPADLGIDQGRFRAARTWKPNWVSSQVAADDAHYVAPLAAASAADTAWSRLRAAIDAQPLLHVIESRPDYLYVEARTPTLGFVDDVEFARTAAGIDVRSSSRLGIRDFGVNRKRVEALRAVIAS